MLTKPTRKNKKNKEIKKDLEETTTNGVRNENLELQKKLTV